MKNLKKVLALVMAFAMAFTMMAGAVYTDQADIVATEAVDTLAALNVMTGDPDGSFRPNDTITRAEACRMIYTIRSNGNSNADAYKGMQTTFTDVDGHWAAGYIKHCQSVGIVSGKSATSFDPNAKVTGVELALMCLRVMGYDPAKADIGGSTWSIKTIGLATEAGLLEDVEAPVEAAIPRQWAAQMMFNMISADTVKWSNDHEEYEESYGLTVGKKYMDLEETKGVLTDVNYDDNDDVYTTVVAGQSFDASKDYSDLMGQEVKALWKEVKGDTVLFGIFATDKNKTVTALVDDIEAVDEDTIKIDKVEYDLAAGCYAVAPNGESLSENDLAPYFEITFVDNNNDKKYEVAVVDAFSVEKVTSVTTKKYYFEITGGQDVDKCNVYKDMAKDDYAVIRDADYTVSGLYEVTEPETISGKVTNTKDGEIKVDGTWYKAACEDAVKAGDTLEEAVVANGFYFTIDGTTSGSVDGTVVALAVGSQEFDSDYYKTKLMFANGDVVTAPAVVEDENDDSKKTAAVVGNIYTYEKDGDNYVLTIVDNGADIDVGKDAPITKSTYSAETNKVVYTRVVDDAEKVIETRVAGDAVVFVKYDGTKGKVITGADADAWADKYTADVFTAFADGTVKIMYVELAGDKVPGASSDAAYAVVIGDIMQGEDDDVVTTLWTADGIVEDVVVTGAEAVKNMVYEYTVDGDEYELTAVKAIVGAVTEIDGDYITVLADGAEVEYKLTKDTDKLFVDTQAGDGAKNGDIREATEFEQNKFYANVIVVVDEDSDNKAATELAVVVVDIDNELQNSADKSIELTKAAK